MNLLVIIIPNSRLFVIKGIHANFTVAGTGLPSPAAAHTANPNTGSSTGSSAEFAEVTVVPVATAGPCNSPCRTIFPFLILLFFMTFVVAITQMPLLMIVLRFVLLFSFLFFIKTKQLSILKIIFKDRNHYILMSLRNKTTQDQPLTHLIYYKNF